MVACFALERTTVAAKTKTSRLRKYYMTTGENSPAKRQKRRVSSVLTSLAGLLAFVHACFAVPFALGIVAAFPGFVAPVPTCGTVVIRHRVAVVRLRLVCNTRQ